MIVSQGDVHNLLENVIHFGHKLVCKRRDIFYPQPTHPLTHWWKLTQLDYITSQYMFDENLKCTFYRDNRKWKYWSAVNVLMISLSFGIHRQIFSFSIWEKHGNGLVWIKNTPTKSPIFSFVLFHHWFFVYSCHLCIHILHWCFAEWLRQHQWHIHGGYFKCRFIGSREFITACIW